MFKRLENNRENEHSLPIKRPRYDTKRGNLGDSCKNKVEFANKKSGKSDDIWGDDFAEEDIEEMDIVASQACIEDDNVLTQSNTKQSVPFIQRYNSAPSTSKSIANINSNKVLGCSVFMSQFNIQRQSTENEKDISSIVSMDYKQFENKLIKDRVYSSTFKTDDTAFLESEYTEELEKLRMANKKLLEDFITKDGEAVFLRNQLQQCQLRSENDRLEKTRFIEEQENRHRSEINTICKEKEHLKTQLELQTFEIGNLQERCKLLENGSVKLVEPHTANFNTYIIKSKFRSPIRNTKSVPVKETCVQTNTYNKISYHLKICRPYFPLAEIPKLIYDLPQVEKPVIDIHIIEKTGRRNLPILQEDGTSRILENPELIKPLTTMIGDKRLTAEFILPELAALQRKTSLELEAENTIPAINKLVSVSQELILNAIIVLQMILQTMTNDDIRDMNDIYFSELYSTSNFNGQSVCSAYAWHECERGIEARRVFGALSYITLESTYLSKYIAGKTRLLTDDDDSYKYYSQEMSRYNAWPDRGRDFEMFKLILQFVVLVGSTRRAHQFSGLMYAIMLIICNVHDKIGYCSQGMEYVYLIFKEIVYSRPLPYCYTLLSNIMMIFMKSTTYLRKLCVNSHQFDIFVESMAVNNWKGSVHFTLEACPLQIFLVQVENHEFDLITAVNITDVLLQFVQHVLHTGIIPLRSENLNSCNCCMKLLRFTIKTLCKCSETNLAATGNFNLGSFPVQNNDFCFIKSICPKHSPLGTGMNKRCIREIYQDKFSDENVWTNMKRRQSKVLRDGIRFLSHLAICDPDFVIRLSDIEDSFHLFIRNMDLFENFHLHQNEQEAMNRIKQTFLFDKTPQSEAEQFQSDSSGKPLDIMRHFEKMTVQPSSATSKKENHNKALLTIKSLFSSTMDFSSH